MFDHYDIIRIINLPSREDRRLEMIGELRRHGIEVDGERVAFSEAISPKEADGFYSIGAHGCYQSHLNILEASGDESVLIIEDDCDFRNNIRHVEVPSCDIFHAGYMSGQIGTHLIGYQPGIARTVASYLRQLLVDGRRISFDGALFHLRTDRPDIKYVFANPVLGFQRPSRTDVGSTDFREKLPFVKELRAVKRGINRFIRSDI